MSAVKDIELTLDPEVEDLLPAHTDDEEKAFRESVDRDGYFTDDLLYWRENGKCVLVDGYRRYRLWQSLPKNSIIPPPHVKEVKLPDRQAVKQWMIRRQLGRRNLSDTARSIYRGKLYNETKSDPTDNLKEGESPKDQNDPSGKQGTFATSAAVSVARETKSSPATVKRDGAFVDALEAIGKVNSKAKSDIEAERMKVSKQAVIAIGKLDKDGIAQALTNIRNGKKWDHKEPPKEDKRTSFNVAEIEGPPTYNFEPHIKALEKLMRFADDSKSTHGRIAEYIAVETHYRKLHAALKALEARVTA